MTASGALLDPGLIARIGQLRIKARTVVDGVLTGLHKSPHHGSSIEFAEHKEYSPGDEIRHIDWRAYARFDRYYVKKFEDETNLRAHLLIDRSSSMGYGDGTLCKLDYAKVLAAAFGYLLLRQQDSSGVVAFSTEIESFVPPRAAGGHYQELLAFLSKIQADGSTDLSTVAEQAGERFRGRNLIVLFSDAFDPDRGALKRLARLRARKNDVVLFQVLHRDETDFPFDSLTEFEDPESGERILADPDAIRAAYRKVVGEFIDTLRSDCLRYGIDHHLAFTDRPHEEALLSFFRRREMAG